MNGWTVQVGLYSCASGGSGFYSNKVTLTVRPVVTPTSLAIATAQTIVGIGQTDLLTVAGIKATAAQT
jgi:hypothetical protein